MRSNSVLFVTVIYVFVCAFGYVFMCMFAFVSVSVYICVCVCTASMLFGGVHCLVVWQFLHFLLKCLCLLVGKRAFGDCVFCC